ncbi:Sytalpha [Lottia gigantea]|uniref:Sytalpha n=1 Tax=Lottia gigantea TaxID=225164 RepID=V3ZY96_LOTGI|nr:Sytalpha [Lottia gigantea]ESO85946.1 Sytalpha [Lottia gigantea]
MSRPSPSAYLIAVYVAVPAVVLLLAIIVVYIYCTKRHRLNWYQRTLLEEYDRGTLGPLLSEGAKTGLMSGKGGRGMRSSSLKSEWMIYVKKMGSSPSSPTNDASEKFWVPPNVLERKRAQSLVPSLSRQDSDEEISSGVTTPASIPGLREFTFNFPSEKIVQPIMSVDGLPSTPPPAYTSRRRASMHDAIDLTKIDARLYEKKPLVRQTSVSSIQEDNNGNIHFSLEYNKETSILTVHLIQAQDLVPRDCSSTLDPYCRVSLLPDRRGDLQSKIQRKTLNPIFEEPLMFELGANKLPSTTLEILVFDYDQFSQDECIGQLHVSLDTVDFSEKTILWKGLMPPDKPKDHEEIGDIMFSMSYLQSAERLTVAVTKARNLRHPEDGKLSLDPYTKVTLILSNRKTKKRKTSTSRGDCNPEWNEALVFNLPNEYLDTICIDVSVFHENKIGNDELLGRVRLSGDSDGDENIHWQDLVSSKCARARWHHLS